MRGLFVACMLLMSMSANPVTAEGTCRFETWLAESFAASVAFVDRLDDDSAKARADNLESLLSAYSLVEIRRELRAKGLAAQEKAIIQYLTRQKALLANVRKRGGSASLALAERLGLPRQIGDMRVFLSRLRCRENDEWRAGPILARLEGLDLQVELRNWMILAGLALAVGSGLLGVTWSQQRRRRREERHVCALPCQFSSANQTQWARAVDVSLNGMKLHLSDRPADGQPCVITILGETVAARVAWSNVEFCGVSFCTSLAPEMLARMLAADGASREKGDALLGDALSET